MPFVAVTRSTAAAPPLWCIVAIREYYVRPVDQRYGRSFNEDAVSNEKSYEEVI